MEGDGAKRGSGVALPVFPSVETATDGANPDIVRALSECKLYTTEVPKTELTALLQIKFHENKLGDFRQTQNSNSRDFAIECAEKTKAGKADEKLSKETFSVDTIVIENGRACFKASIIHGDDPTIRALSRLRNDDLVRLLVSMVSIQWVIETHCLREYIREFILDLYRNVFVEASFTTSASSWVGSHVVVFLIKCLE